MAPKNRVHGCVARMSGFDDPGRHLHRGERSTRQRDFYPLLERATAPHSKAVSEMLGHSQIGIIFDLSSHVTVTMQQQAVTALDDLFGDL
jgi:hypothetical protein